MLFALHPAGMRQSLACFLSHYLVLVLLLASLSFAAASSAQTQLQAINAGGSAVTPYVADNAYSGGSTYSVTASINTSGVANPAPQAVYQTERYGNCTYTLPGYTSGVTYTVRLHFSENYVNGPGQRLFGATINGTQVLNNFDIFAAAGGAYIAIVRSYSAVADSSGKITVTFTNGSQNNAKIDGIEVLAGAFTPTLTSIAVSPASATVTTNGTQQFTAVAKDQNGNALATQPTFTWSVVSGGVGTVSSTGLYSAGTTAGSATVQATSSSVSGTATVTISNPLPTAPTGVYAYSYGGNKVRWNGVSSATSYNLYRSTTSGSEVLLTTGITSQDSQSFYTNDTSGVSGTTYYYKVAAVNSSGVGPQSSEVSVTAGSAMLPATTLTAQPGTGTVALTWTAISGASSYNLLRATGSGSPSVYQTGITGTSYTDTGLTNGTPYKYYVDAVSPSGAGNDSNTVTATPLAPPSAPSLSASTSSTYVSLNWTAVASATSYNLYRSTASGGEGATPYKVNVTSGTGTSFTDSSLTSGTSYYYQITAVTNGVEGTKSNEASAIVGSAALAAPVLKGVAGATSNALTWNAISGATSYNLYRYTSSSYYGGTLYQQGLTATSFTDSGLTAGTAYSYYVCAVNTSGQGNQSNTVSLTPGSAALAAPVLSASTSSTYISLSWTAVTGATSYDLYRSTTAGGEGTIPYKVNVTSGTGTSFTDSGLTTGTTYFYTVVPVGPGGEGTASNEASATVGSAALAAPLLKGVAGATSNALTWSAVPGATSYNLYRYTSSSYYGGVLYQQGLTATSFSDKSLTAGTAYSYYICAVNVGGQGSQSNTVSLTPGSTALAAPVLAASTSSTYISLTWTAVTGATSYDLYRSTTAGGEGSIPYKVNVTSGTGTSFSDSSLTSGTTYYYTVVPVGPGGEGNASNEASATVGAAALVAPVLKGVAGATTNMLTWSAISGATSYNVYRTSGSNYYGYGSTLYQQGLTTTSFTDSGLTAGTAYSYYICAVNTSGQGNQSNTISLTPGSAALAAPLLSAQAVSGQTYVSLSWTTVTGATSYDLYRSTTAGGEGASPYQVGVSSGMSDSGLTAGTTYYYKVVAVGPDGEGNFSNEASATVGAAQLAAPVLKGVAGATSNVLTWNAVSGATSYNLYRTSGSSYYGYGGTLYQQGLTSISYTDSGLAAGTAYNYYVCAVNTSGQGTQSNTVSLTPGSAALAAPLLSAQTSSGQTSISLNWTAVTGASSYNVYRSTTAGGEGTIPYQVGQSNTSYYDSNLTAGTTYYYKVVAVGPGGEGTFSNEASATVGTAPLAAPILKGKVGATTNTLTWSAISGALSYNLYRTSGSNYYGYGGTLYQQGLTSTSFNDPGLTSGTQYNYYVCAVNTSGQGAQSNTVSLTPGSTTIAAPLLTASTSTSTYNGLGSVSLSWTSVTGATSYNLYRSTSAGGEGSIPYQVGLTSTSYNDGSLTPGTTYYYKVVAVGPGGEGALSNEASATVGTAPLAAPSSLTATAAPNNGQSIVVAWGAVLGATSYNIYRTTGTSSSPGYYPGYSGTLYQQGVTGTTWTDTNVQYGPTYTYTVSPVSVNGQGAQSNAASATLFGFGTSTAPNTITIARGTVGSVNVLVTPSAGFTGVVNLSGTGLPSGTTAWFYPAAATLSPIISPQSSGQPSGGINGVVSAGLYLAVSSSTAPGTYVISILGASGGFTNTTTVLLTIN